MLSYEITGIDVFFSGVTFIESLIKIRFIQKIKNKKTSALYNSNNIEFC